MPTSVPLRKIWYAVTPVLSVDGFHPSAICVVPVRSAFKPDGVDGGVVSDGCGVAERSIERALSPDVLTALTW